MKPRLKPTRNRGEHMTDRRFKAQLHWEWIGGDVGTDRRTGVLSEEYHHRPSDQGGSDDASNVELAHGKPFLIAHAGRDARDACCTSQSGVLRSPSSIDKPRAPVMTARTNMGSRSFFKRKAGPATLMDAMMCPV